MKSFKIFFVFFMAAVLFSLSSLANAAEVLKPFYGPEPGHVLSKTSFEMSKTEWKNDYKEKYKTLQETIYYGISDAWALYFDASDTWIDPSYGSKYEKTYWDIGIGYFFEPSRNTSIDMELYYAESKAEECSKEPSLYWYSRFDFLKYRKTKPFIGFEYSRDLTHFTKNGSVNEMSFFAGAWTKFENKVLLKGNLKAVYNHSFPESTSALFNVETGYQFADNFAVTLNGDYVFYSHNVQDYDIESSFGGGVLIKYLF